MTEYVSFSPLLQTLLPTKGQFPLLTDRENKSLLEVKWDDKAFILKGTDFLLHIWVLILGSLLYVWLYSQRQLLWGEKNGLKKCFVRNRFHWAKTNFCLNSLMYPETRRDQGGAALFLSITSLLLILAIIILPLLPHTGCLHFLPAHPFHPCFGFCTTFTSSLH